MEEQERVHDEARLGSLNLLSDVTANFDETKSAKKGRLFAETKVRNCMVKALLDTGANNNFLEQGNTRTIPLTRESKREARHLSAMQLSKGAENAYPSSFVPVKEASKEKIPPEGHYQSECRKPKRVDKKDDEKELKAFIARDGKNRRSIHDSYFSSTTLNDMVIEFHLVENMEVEECPPLIRKYFKGKMNVRLKELEAIFVECSDKEDSWKMGLIFLIYQYLFASDNRRNGIDKDMKHLRVLYLAKKKTWDKKSVYDVAYTLHGFALAFQVWTFELINTFVPKFAKRTHKIDESEEEKRKYSSFEDMRGNVYNEFFELDGRRRKIEGCEEDEKDERTPKLSAKKNRLISPKLPEVNDETSQDNSQQVPSATTPQTDKDNFTSCAPNRVSQAHTDAKLDELTMNRTKRKNDEVALDTEKGTKRKNDEVMNKRKNDEERKQDEEMKKRKHDEVDEIKRKKDERKERLIKLSKKRKDDELAKKELAMKKRKDEMAKRKNIEEEEENTKDKTEEKTEENKKEEIVEKIEEKTTEIIEKEDEKTEKKSEENKEEEKIAEVEEENIAEVEEKTVEVEEIVEKEVIVEKKKEEIMENKEDNVKKMSPSQFRGKSFRRKKSKKLEYYTDPSGKGFKLNNSVTVNPMLQYDEEKMKELKKWLKSKDKDFKNLSTYETNCSLFNRFLTPQKWLHDMNVNDIPPPPRDFTIQIDQKNEAILLPILGSIVPFHVGLVKSVSSQQILNHNCYIRIMFNVPGTPFSSPESSNIDVRDAYFRCKDPRHLSDLVQKIETLRRQVTCRELEKAERATLVTQEKLQLGKFKPIMLSGLWIRPTFYGWNREGKI
ncbi:uncharacterized protein LOC124937949 [Impatiens glandulifera]|uniref:uncharacterized protein LOC124937949 n=1 Tax=Impatiens glandulifera TaxID=253017 RepID=UPI001FB077FF|nr:uncharacterized protein LOC124937949 [Impatiens glandulifera]